MRTEDGVAVAGRILLATIFVISGGGKVADPHGTQAFIASAGLPVPIIAYCVAIIIELGASTLLVLGLWTRLVAAVMACFTLAAAFAFHAHFADQDQWLHFLKNLAIAGGFLQVVALGPGAWSLDARMRAERASVAERV
jgi:putative oxidoreductase